MQSQAIEQSGASQELLRLMMSFIPARALYVAAKMGIADHLRDSAKTASELANATSGNADALYRIMRLMSALGVVREDEEQRFSLTQLGNTLRSGTPKSVRDYVIMYHETVFELFNELPECVRSGQSAFELTHGKSNFEHLDANPAARKVYAAGLANQTRLDNAAILESYDFGNAGIVADIGGGSGALLFAILEKHQNLEGILFERDSVVELVRSTHNQDTERHSLVAGDFFKAVPVQADVLVLKQVLHDWQDDECVKILQNCRSAVEKKGKLLIVERLIGAANATILTPILDVTMLAATGGRERREDEYAALFTRAGFALRRVIPTGLEMNILEAAPV